MAMNMVGLSGRLTKDVEYSPPKTQNGRSKASFTLAVQRDFKNSEGNYEADFVRCVTWGVTADLAVNSLKKGSHIGVQGKIRTGSYTDANQNKVFTTEVEIASITFLDKKENGNGNGNGQNHQPQTGGYPNQPQAGGGYPNQPQAGGGYPNQPQAGGGYPNQPQAGGGYPNQPQAGGGYPNQPQAGGYPNQQVGFPNQ